MTYAERYLYDDNVELPTDVQVETLSSDDMVIAEGPNNSHYAD